MQRRTGPRWAGVSPCLSCTFGPLPFHLLLYHHHRPHVARYRHYHRRHRSRHHCVWSASPPSLSLPSDFLASLATPLGQKTTPSLSSSLATFLSLLSSLLAPPCLTSPCLTLLHRHARLPSSFIRSLKHPRPSPFVDHSVSLVYSSGEPGRARLPRYISLREHVATRSRGHDSSRPLCRYVERFFASVDLRPRMIPFALSFSFSFLHLRVVCSLTS